MKRILSVCITLQKALLVVFAIKVSLLQASAEPLGLATIYSFQEIELPEFTGDIGKSPDWLLHIGGSHWRYKPKINTRFIQATHPSLRQKLISDNIIVYSGSLEDENGNEIPQSWVRLTQSDGIWSGGLYDGHELYIIEHKDRLSRQDFTETGKNIIESANGYLSFRLSDIVSPFLIDEVVTPLSSKEAETPYTTSFDPNNKTTDTVRQLPITIVTDAEFSGLHGSTVFARVITRLNFADGIFYTHLNISLGLLHHEALTDNGTLTATNASLLAVQFSNFLGLNGAGASIPRVGLTHLFTGRILDNNVLGVAYLHQLCNRGGSGLDRDHISDAASGVVFAHEAGHNFGAPHDGSGACINETMPGIMYPFFSGVTTRFSNCSVQEMSVDVANATCFNDVPLLLLENSFEN